MSKSIQDIPNRRRPQLIAERIGDLISLIGPGRRLPSIDELCGKLDTSRATVNLALELLEAGGKVVRRRGSGIYTPELAKRSLLPILMGVDPLKTAASPFYRLLLHALRASAAARGFRADLYAGFAHEGRGRWDESEPRESLNQQIRAELVRGILHVTGWAVNDYFKNQGVPIVGLQSYFVPGDRTVGVHGEKLAALAVEELQRRGKHKIILVGGAADAHGNPMSSVPGVHEIYDPFSGGFDPIVTPYEERGLQIGLDLIDRLRSDARAFDALLITDDMLARGLLIALLRAGIVPGRDLAVASQTNRGSPTLLGFQQDLIQLEIDPSEIAEKMMTLLDEQIAGDNAGRVELVAPRLILPMKDAT